MKKRERKERYKSSNTEDEMLHNFCETREECKDVLKNDALDIKLESIIAQDNIEYFENRLKEIERRFEEESCARMELQHKFN